MSVGFASSNTVTQEVYVLNNYALYPMEMLIPLTFVFNHCINAFYRQIIIHN